MKLTLSQLDIYFEQLLYPDEPIYNIGAKIEIIGNLNIQSFKKAYVALIDQHDSYRMILKKKEEDVIAEVLKTHDSQLGFIDFSDQNNSTQKANAFMQEEFMKPFNLLEERLLHKFVLIKVQDEMYYLFSVYHHIITDGWGTSLMFQRLVKNYNEIEEHGAVQSEYPYTYQDYVTYDEDYQNSKEFLVDRQYWIDKFKQLPESFLEKNQKINFGHRSKRKELIVKRATYNRLNELAKEYKGNTFHLILAMLYIYFGRKHQNEDFAIGLPVLNRGKAAFKKTVGLFMGVSPLRISFSGNDTILDLITKVKNQLRKDYRHQRFPLGKIIQELQIFKQKERLFNITLSYEKQNYANNFVGTKTKVIPLTHQSERVALAIYIREFDEADDVKIDFDYNLNYFDESSIGKTVAHIEKLMVEILIDPIVKLKEFNFLTPSEKNKVLFDFNTTDAIYKKDKTLINIFEEQLADSHNQLAIFDDQVNYTYAELQDKSNQVAAYLTKALGENDKAPIAVMMNRSADLILVLLGILKSGRAYIPLDPIFPKDRIEYILQNSGAISIIKKGGYELDKAEKVSIIEYDEMQSILVNYPKDFLSKSNSKDLAYIIYTSGSTGNPKGVKIGHQSLINFLLSMQKEPGISSKDLLFSVTTCSFDISILEFFTPLLCGGKIYIAKNDELSEPNLIIQKINQIKPTIIQATPSFYQMLFNAKWDGDAKLRILCGGDLLSDSLAEKLLGTCAELWNMYGPTECTIWSSVKKINSPIEASNIGTPIDNTQFYILDDYFNPMPVSTMGAIYIGGDGLAKGYHNKPQLTQQKFISNPFIKAGMMYETGDVGKWNEVGEIEFLGRNDNQVKIRGFRIELGEIEAKINLIEGIKQAVVIAKKRSQQESFLVAYVSTESNIDEQQIIETLRIDLPEYMVPYTIISLSELPLTPNKKIDRKQLSQRTIEIDNQKPILASSVIEIQLSEYWKEVLQINHDISTTSNFFALGGNSLSAVKLTALINSGFLVNLNLKTIFDYPTIAELSLHLHTVDKESSQLHIPSAENKEKYELTPAQYNIWLASQRQEISIAYNMFSAYDVMGELDLGVLKKAINYIIKKHEVLRTNFIEVDGQPYQKIHQEDIQDFEIGIQEPTNRYTQEEIIEFVNQEFNLETDILVRVELFRQEEGGTILAFCAHHLIMDGWSLEIFTKECIENYNQLLEKDAIVQKKLEYQFKDYTEWEIQQIKENNSVTQSFWDEYLKDYENKIVFRPDLQNQKEHSGDEYELELTLENTIALKELGKKYKTTIHSILTAALNALVYKITGNEDICIGTVNSGRNTPEFINHIGMFVKTLPLRTQIKAEQNFLELVKTTEENLIGLDKHQNISKQSSDSILYDLLLVYQNPEFTIENIDQLQGVQLTPFPTKNRHSRLPISFNFFEQEQQLVAIVNYDASMYSAESIQIISHKFTLFLNQIVKNANRKLDEIDLALHIDKAQVVDFDFNF